MSAWRSLAEVLETEEAPDNAGMGTWERADLERHLASENRSVGAREATAARNAVIRAQHDRGVELEALMEIHGLSQRQVLRIVRRERE